MIELVVKRRSTFWYGWTEEDRAIIGGHPQRLRMVEHDRGDAVLMLVDSYVGADLARSMVGEAAES